mmetsp:Transcript_13690/g.43240  ORF Transcript_13690/g.43240 Transcript_13690/m.43240 type:complete len:298 (-) Transcript_13690:929-1822(-)
MRRCASVHDHHCAHVATQSRRDGGEEAAGDRGWRRLGRVRGCEGSVRERMRGDAAGCRESRGGDVDADGEAVRARNARVLEGLPEHQRARRRARSRRHLLGVHREFVLWTRRVGMHGAGVLVELAARAAVAAWPSPRLVRSVQASPDPGSHVDSRLVRGNGRLVSITRGVRGVRPHVGARALSARRRDEAFGGRFPQADAARRSVQAARRALGRCHDGTLVLLRSRAPDLVRCEVAQAGDGAVDILRAARATTGRKRQFHHPLELLRQIVGLGRNDRSRLSRLVRRQGDGRRAVEGL